MIATRERRSTIRPSIDPAKAMSTGSTGHIPFNRAHVTGDELDAVATAIAEGHLSADGSYTHRCSSWLEQSLDCCLALLTHSCTAGLELSALLLELEPGDEVIMPSYTFVTTANAFALHGATPVFVDVREDTLNLDEALVEQAITDRTRAIVPVHYAGVGCEMDALAEISRAYSIPLVEDAAQGICATYRGKALGAIGALGSLSFHETKNVTCGHGGALIINDERFIDRAEILRDKGTNRSSFVRGEVGKYTWLDIGSSYALSDLAAAFLWPQLERSEAITAKRRELWDHYHAGFAEAERAGLVRRPVVPEGCEHNAHMYYLLLPDHTARDRLIAELNQRDINAVFHYIPLHSSPGGRKFGRTHGRMRVTDEFSSRLVRLPLWSDMDLQTIDVVVNAVCGLVSDDRNGRELAGYSGLTG
jgi:dTDP-4-amino-4,6-dideoxygalactose transaminase